MCSLKLRLADQVRPAAKDDSRSSRFLPVILYDAGKKDNAGIVATHTEHVCVVKNGHYCVPLTRALVDDLRLNWGQVMAARGCLSGAEDPQPGRWLYRWLEYENDYLASDASRPLASRAYLIASRT